MIDNCDVRTLFDKAARYLVIAVSTLAAIIASVEKLRAADCTHPGTNEIQTQQIDTGCLSGDLTSSAIYHHPLAPSPFTRRQNDFSITPISLNTNQKTERETLTGAQFNFQHNELGTRLAYAESNSDTRFFFASLNYSFNLNDSTALLLDGQLHRGEDSGYPKSSSQSKVSSDTDANLVNLNAQLTISQLSLSASFSQVDAPGKSSLGAFDYFAINPNKGSSYWTRRQISDFNYHGEKIWQASIAYNFHHIGAPGLTLGYTYTYGNDIKINHPEFTEKYRESEHNLEIGYLFQKPQLKGLGLKLQYAQYLADKAITEINSSDNEIPVSSGNSDLKVYLDYSVTFF